MAMFHAIPFIVFPLAMIFAAFSDLLTMTIPNRLHIILLLGFVVLALMSGMATGMLGLHFATAAGCLVLTFGFFAAGWMGGGDAKLAAVTALWLGPSEAMTQYALLASIYGGALTLGLLAVRSHIQPVTGIGFIDRLLGRETGIPYGIALGLAGLVAYSQSFWMDLSVAGAL